MAGAVDSSDMSIEDEERCLAEAHGRANRMSNNDQAPEAPREGSTQKAVRRGGCREVVVSGL